MSKKQMELYFLGLISISLLMLVTNVGMFVRMNQFQQQVLTALQPFHIPMGLRTGENAPNFHLDTLTSERISLQDYKGSTVLLVFSSITCPACQQFYPEL